jgi:hypothetical protein
MSDLNLDQFSSTSSPVQAPTRRSAPLAWRNELAFGAGDLCAVDQAAVAGPNDTLGKPGRGSAWWRRGDARERTGGADARLRT